MITDRNVIRILTQRKIISVTKYVENNEGFIFGRFSLFYEFHFLIVCEIVYNIY